MPATTDRSITIAAVQMDIQPAHTDSRLYRADQIIQDAVQLGAELVVLPELFNTGYAYVEENFAHAETGDGSTVTWMKRIARRMGVHLAGTLLLREDGDIYNAMLLVAPDGHTWRYDKSFPWGWERGYFRENRLKGSARAVVAKTTLGDLGMLVCWDIAHPELWQSYAGQVDLLVVCSSPPQVTNLTFYLPPDVVLGPDRLGPLWASRKGEGRQVFGTMLDEHARWLGIPVANSAGCGTFTSPVPNGQATLLGLIPSAPGLIRYLTHANEMTIRAEMIDACRIISGEGKSLAQRSQARGEGFTIAEVHLPENRPRPQDAQPATQASRVSFFISDTFLPRSMLSTYQQGLRRSG